MNKNRRLALKNLAASPVALLGAKGGFLASQAFAPAHAQMYPDRPVRILIGAPPGAGPDVEARQFAAMLQLELGQPVIVENKPGVSQLLAMEAVSKAVPDGYTLGAGSPSNLTGSPRLFDRPLFNVEKDFTPVSQFIEHPWVLYVNANVPVRTLAEFVALAKASPGKITYASTGVGSYLHVTGEWFQKLAGIKLQHVPYGATHFQTDLLGGVVDAVFYPLLLADHVRSGKLRALAVASQNRSALLPEVPTFAEAGYKDYSARAWAGLVAPAGTPAAIIERLGQASARAAQRPEFRDFTTRFGAANVGSSPADFARYLRTERAQMQVVIRDNNIRME
jgi:tripartite-type tricarboxylate transporter receptor subunit TctC